MKTTINRRGRLRLRHFQSLPTRFRTPQTELQDWLAEAHARAGGMKRRSIETLLSYYGASADHIAYRGYELPDFSHHRWNEMRLFGPAGSTIEQKTQFFDECIDSVFQRLYPSSTTPPSALVHVTCTGYSAPSGAQRLISARGWGAHTQVLHAYHMGCYAAHPAIRMAAGQLSASGNSDAPVDVVHTELCSLHLDPASKDPAQLVIQSLFSDGFIKYQVAHAEAVPDEENLGSYFDILAMRDDIVPDSLQAMSWATGSPLFHMGLSKEVPTLFASALPRFIDRLFQDAGFDLAAEKAAAVFAIHPGGPRIIELSQQILDLAPAQVSWSRHVLREHGNMSSATLPHIWKRIVEDDLIPDGTLIISVGAGPGLTLSGALFRKLC